MRHRRSTSAVLFAVLAVATVIGTAEPAAACTCVGRSDTEALEAADAVFSGEVTSAQVSALEPQRYVFDVDLVYKGVVGSRQTVVSPQGGGACGLDLVGPGPFLVFASTSGGRGLEPAEGELFSHLCTRTAPLDAFPVLERFGSGVPPGVAAAVDEPADIDGGDRSVVPIALGVALVLALVGASVLFRRQRRT